ncbi:MAG TPA: GTPase domain-containing protein [Pirellulales bacterium]|jgi:hypothetical protein|nr:GTPase domain-containing protein [Pirellulales bacterium]
MPGDYLQWAGHVKRLDEALARLLPAAAALGVPSAAGQEWFELLRHKLMPQVLAPEVLVVAITGGTNIGKSVIFNQLAGENASGVSPLAAGTKHPVCLVPKLWEDARTLASLFAGFELRAWKSASDPLAECPADLLFWRTGAAVPPRLLLLDTPDIDSDVEVNWHRADVVRQVADVLIAVLTQQKYNDASVKRFFRKAAAADKPVIVVFNQCDLTLDRDYWPQWLETFASETGARPEYVYVFPYDRAASAALALPCYSVGPDGRTPPEQPADLRADLAGLHFDTIKIRTLRGALAGVLDPARGARQYLDQVRIASGDFADAQRSLSATQMARIRWPSLPVDLLIDEIRAWWDTNHRTPWSRSIHRVYRGLGQGIAWPLARAWEAMHGPAADPLEIFHRLERQAIVEGIQELFEQLSRLAEVGNSTLKPRLAALVGGDVRARILERVEQAHAGLPDMDEDYRKYVRGELDAWGRENPKAVAFLRSLDHVLALARPAVTVSLAVSGGILAGDVMGQAAAQVAGHTAGQLAAEAAITGGVTVGGEAAITATGQGLKHSAAVLFRRLQNRYAEQRARWLAGWLEHELLGDLLAKLRRGAQLAESPLVRDVEDSLCALAKMIVDEPSRPAAPGD